MREIVVSGTRPTGFLHLGNYLGAVKQYVEMQESYECYFFIADLHSLTTHPNPRDLNENSKIVLAEYLASGLDPEKITIYLQSDLPQIPQLYLFLNMHAYKGELERVTTFKEKARSQPDNVNAGLLTYPTLMAADILIHKATKVPVGKDQEQHLEMARTFARRFNTIYKKEVFPEPQAFNFGKALIKVPGLQSAIKMEEVSEPFIRRRAIRHLEKGRIVIFAAGTGNPYFTTDTAAVLRAIEINADVILKGTRVDGIYTADPEKDRSATKFTNITFDEVYSRNLNVMDMTAITLCKENNLPIVVFNINEKDAFLRVVEGETVGTLVG